MIPNPFRRAKPAPAPAPISPSLSRFDAFSHEEIAALPKRLRREVVADRKRRVTAALVRVVQGRGRDWE